MSITNGLGTHIVPSINESTDMLTVHFKIPYTQSLFPPAQPTAHDGTWPSPCLSVRIGAQGTGAGKG